MTDKAKAWYRSAHVLVSIHERVEGGFQHPNLLVRRVYDGRGHTTDSRLPADLDDPTTNSESLLAFRFQQNVDEVPEKAWFGQPWLTTTAKTPSPTYAGRLETEIRLEQTGVALDFVQKKLRSVDKALHTYRERCRELAVQRSGCDLTVLALALKTVWRIPLLFVCWRAKGQHIVVIDPDPAISTFARIEASNRAQARYGQ